jgi:ubiquinol-cytochrome c reductase cytochrome c1 subunit
MTGPCHARWCVGLALAFGLPLAAQAAGEAEPPIDRDWPHHGIFGTFDRAAVQRGMQVYKEVCAGCHGVKYLAFRNLADIGFSEDEIRAIAADYMITDGPDEMGDMFERPGIAADRFPSPFPNEQAAAAANNGVAPPDLSLMVKARGGGENYLYSLLVGYEDPPADFELPDGGYYNPYFPGHVIAMAQPLYPDSVVYADGTEASVSQMAADLTQFLAWVAEPRLEERKQTGIKVMLFLIVLCGILYAYKRRIWADVH